MNKINSNIIIICRTEYELDVKYLYYWNEEIIKVAKSRNLYIIDLKNDNFTKNKLEKLTDDKNPFLFIGNGHGTNWSFNGHNNERVIEACKNDIILKNKIVYLLACDTANILAESALKKGCSCFIGYSGKYIFIREEPTPNNVLEDTFAQAFMEISNQIPLTIINGGTPEDAWRNFQKKCEEWIEWWSKTLNPVAPQIISALLKDSKRLRLFRI